MGSSEPVSHLIAGPTSGRSTLRHARGLWLLASVTVILAGLVGCRSGDDGNPLQSMRIGDGMGALAPYQVEQLSATATYKDGKNVDVTSVVRWSSTDDAVISVDSGGRAIALAPGTATIRATHPTGGVSTSVGLSVVMAGEVTLNALQLLPDVPSLTLAPGESIFVMALGQYSDGTRIDFSSQTQWNSSNPLVAPITVDGQAMTSATGSTQLFGTVLDPDDALHTVQGAKSLGVQLIPPGPDPVRDWIELEIPDSGTADLFLEGEEAAPPAPVAPQLRAYYSEIYTLVPVTRILMSNSSQALMDAWVAGNTVGRYDMASSARLHGELPGALPGLSLRAGPDVPGSGGHITLTRMGTPGGRVHGYLEATGCLYSGETAIGCGYAVTSAFSLKREADESFVAEGTAAPVPLTLDVTTAGTVDTTSSYYLLDGLSTDTGYFLRLLDASDDVSLTVAADGTFSPIQCTSQNPGVAQELCGVLTGPAQTALHVRVDYQGTGDGAVFKLLPTVSPYVNEGEALTPSDMGMAPVNHSGMVDHTASYYAVGVPIGTSVRVDVSTDELTAMAATVEVFTDSGFSLPFCTVQELAPHQVACGGTTDGSTDVLFIKVTGDPSLPGESFFMNVAVHPNEGVDTAPVPLALRVTRSGTVGLGYSYYTVATEPARTYEVTLTPLVEPATLAVFEDAFVAPLCTQASGQVVLPEGAGSAFTPAVCELTATGSVLNIRVDGTATLGGTSFELRVRPLFTSEGTLAVPVELTVGTPHTGAVASGETSYYAATVDRFADHTVVFSATRPDQVASLYGDSAFTELICELDAAFEDRCAVTAGAYDRIYVNVSNDSGGDFTLFVGEGLLFEETYLLSHGEIHYGTVNNAQSHFSVLPLLGADFDVDITSASDNVDLAVYGGAEGTTLLCSSANAGTADEHCLVRADEYPLDIVVDGSNTIAGAEYLVSLSLPQWEAEGTSGAPTELTPFQPYLGRVDTTASYYWMPATAGTTYAAQLTASTADVTLQMFDAAGFAGAAQCESATPGASDETCTVLASTSAVYVAVLGPLDDTGAGFKLQVSPLPASEGQVTPIGLTLDATRPSEVDTTYSDYKLGTTAGTIYAFDLTGATDAVSMEVFSDALFTVLVCTTGSATTGTSTCYVDAPGTALYVRVYGSSTVQGAYFELTASLAPFTALVSQAPLVTTGADMYFYYDTDSATTYTFSFDTGVPGLEATLAEDVYITQLLEIFDLFNPASLMPPGNRVYLRVSTQSVGAGQPFSISVSP